jgi:5'(3')-deoxyribonucleotidase
VLNAEFEAQYDTEEYEGKIRVLFQAAHKRLRKENFINIDKWKECIRFLKKGGHYILVLGD